MVPAAPPSPKSPTYPGKFRVYLQIFRAALQGRKRSLRADAVNWVDQLSPPLRVYGADNLPSSGPCLITANHYCRPGFNAMWIGMAISAASPVEVHWLVTSSWGFEGKWYAPIGQKISQRVIGRLAKVYDFTLTPPMPPKTEDSAERAGSVRRLAAFARKNPSAVIAITPEGQDFPGGVLGTPPPGSGRLLHHLSRMGFPILPAGIYEEGGELRLNVGSMYHLELPEAFPNHEIDAFTSRTVMQQISLLLPSHLRGAYPCESD